MLAVSRSPTVMSDGVRSVRTVTSMSPKVTAGAWSPPNPCPNAGDAATANRARPATAAKAAILAGTTPAGRSAERMDEIDGNHI